MRGNEAISNPFFNSASEDDGPTAKWVAIADKIEDVAADGREPNHGAGARRRTEASVTVNLESESNFYVGLTGSALDGGIFIATHLPSDIGSPVDLTIVLPQEPPIQAKGTVRWLRAYSDANETTPGMGIRLDHLATDDAIRIREFAKSRQPIFFDDEVNDGDAA